MFFAIYIKSEQRTKCEHTHTHRVYIKLCLQSGAVFQTLYLVVKQLPLVAETQIITVFVCITWLNVLKYELNIFLICSNVASLSVLCCCWVFSSSIITT